MLEKQTQGSGLTSISNRNPITCSFIRSQDSSTMHLSDYSLVLLSLSLLVILCSSQSQFPNSSTFQVGVILNLGTAAGRMALTSLSLSHSDFYSASTNYTTKLQLHVRNSSEQVTDAAAAALGLLKEVKVDAILGPLNSAQASFVIELGDRSNVPIISFSASAPAFQPPSPYFVRTAVSDSVQVSAIAAIFQHFQWRQVLVLYEDSDYGNSIVPHLSNALQDVNVRISYRSIIRLSETDDVMLGELYKMKNMSTRIFVAHVSPSLGSRLFPKVKEAGMMAQGYAWIVTSGMMDLLFLLDPHVIETSMQGVLGVKPLIPRSSKLSSAAARWKREFLLDHYNSNIKNTELSLQGLWAYDTLSALAMAAERVGVTESASHNTTLSTLNSTNLFSTEISKTGPKLLEALSRLKFQGLSGNFNLLNGQLESPSFQILSIIGKGEREVGMWTKLDGILSESKLNTTIFPGDSLVVPKGWEVPISGKKLRIGVPVAPGYTGFVMVEKDTQTNATKISGCYIELFEAVMAKLPYAVPYEFVPFQDPNGSMAGTYDELSYQEYDAVVGDTTITTKRSKYVDFTLPFAVGGVVIVVPITYNDSNDKWFFLKPLKKELWATSIALFFFTGLVVWILERRYNKAYRGPLPQHLGMIFYFPFMSLVFAQSERIVTNFARIVIVVWVFVVLVLSSTYTANLSAKFTIESLQPTVRDARQLIRKGDNVGCHKGSFVVDLLKDLGFEESKIRTYVDPEDCDDDLFKGSAKGGISAFFAVSPYVDLFMSKYCGKYTTIGPTYDTEGYAYVFPKGSPLVADISHAVVELRESGRASEIERQCSKDQPCSMRDAISITSSGVSLKSFQALFGITGGVTTTCLVIFIVKFVYDNKDFVGKTCSWSQLCELWRLFNEKDPKSLGSPTVKEDEEHPLPTLLDVDNSPWGTIVPVSTDEDLSHSPISELLSTPEHHSQLENTSS